MKKCYLVYKNLIMIWIKFRSLNGFYVSKIDRFDNFIYCQFLISLQLETRHLRFW